MKYVLDVAKWICGGGATEGIPGNCTGYGRTQMLNEHDYMCCLGQFARQAGVPPTNLIGNGSPLGVAAELRREGHENSRYDDAFVDMRGGCTELATELIDINDNRDSTIQQKLDSLREKLNAAGHELEVINA